MSNSEHSYDIYFFVCYSDGAEISKEEYTELREDLADIYGIMKPIRADVDY